MVHTLLKLWRDDEAPTAVEYGLMVALIAIVIITAVALLGTNVQATFNTMAAGMVKRLWQDEEAPTAVEYGLMVALIAVVIITAVALLGTNVQATFNQVAASMP